MEQGISPLQQDNQRLANEQAGSWDVGVIATALAAVPELTSADDLGSGVRFRLGNPESETLLEVFPTGPHSPVVRLSSPDLQVSLFHQTEAPRLEAEGLVFELEQGSDRRWLALSPATGELTLFSTPGASRTRQDAANPSQGPDIPVPVESSQTGHAVAAEPSMQTALPEGRQTKQPRVTFSGRLGTDPRCRTTPREVLVCAFPVAEKRDGFEKPTWRDVVTFNQVAAKVQEGLRKGMFVDVIGYEHEKAKKGKDGTIRMAKEVYAVAVKQR